MIMSERGCHYVLDRTLDWESENPRSWFDSSANSLCNLEPTILQFYALGKGGVGDRILEAWLTDTFLVPGFQSSRTLLSVLCLLDSDWPVCASHEQRSPRGVPRRWRSGAPRPHSPLPLCGGVQSTAGGRGGGGE